MHFVYFAEKKLERFYDYLVERTEEKITKRKVKGVEGKVRGKGKAKVGKLLAMLGLGEMEVEAEVSTAGKLSFQTDIVAKFTAAQKVKALVLKLNCEEKLVALSASADLSNFPKEGSPIFFTARLKTDYNRRSEVDVERTQAAILAGEIGDASVEIQASIEYMESKNAWRRWQSPTKMVGFGTVIGAYADKKLLEIDPIVLGYAWPS
ncbi:MAG: hypothetical protein ACYS9T_00215 [Planctomycetota bacterium]|jgi:hypothetical protein